MNVTLLACATLAGIVGLLSGFQGIYERYHVDSLRAGATAPGFFYLVTRAALPSVLFVVAYSYNLISSDMLLLKALGFGTGTEVLLRSRVYVKQTEKGSAQLEDLLRGPLDLLKWYQDLFLGLAAARLAEIRREFIDNHLPSGRSFTDLRIDVLNNLGAWPNEDERNKLDSALSTLQVKYVTEKGEGKNGQLDQKYRLKLAYLILEGFGKRGFKTLVVAR
jgi:hypothetical protein